MGMEIREVKTRKDWKAFFSFPDKLYANNPYYVPPLISDERKQFDPTFNPALEFCEYACWLVYEQGKVTGRIAGIVNHRYNEYHDTLAARFSWFDLYDDPAIAALLIGTVETWAKQKGMTRIIGPYGFTSFNSHGILVEGYEEIPTPYGRYNYPYYRQIIEGLGFTKEVEWVESRIGIPDGIPEKMQRIASYVKERYSLRVLDNSSIKNLLPYSHAIFHLLNTANARFYGFLPMTDRQINLLVADFKKFLISKYISVVLNKDDEIIAFGLSIPDIAVALQKAKGRLWPLGFYYLWRALHHNDTMDLMLIGVRPDYQMKGVNALLFEQLIPIYIKNKYRQVETLQNQADNRQVQAQWDYFDRRIHKRTVGYGKDL